MSKSGVIVLDKAMVKSPVWLSLSRTATQVYLLFRCKCQIAKRDSRQAKRSDDFMGRLLNNGEIEFTYIEAKKEYGITPGRFVRAIDELVVKGFLDIAETGMGLYKAATHYAISNRWLDYNTHFFRQKSRPVQSIKRGFHKGNKYWLKASRKKSTAVSEHEAMCKNVHGEVLTVHTNAHGQKVTKRYNFYNGKWLCKQIA